MPKKKTTIEDLARIMNRGFDHLLSTTSKKADIDKQFEQVNVRLDHLSARLVVVERDIADIRKHFIYRDEFEDALARISLVEKKLGIKSGK